MTHPAIPGLEVHIPKGVVLREFDGKIVKQVQHHADSGLGPRAFTRRRLISPGFTSRCQPGGAFCIDGGASKSIKVIYPNYTHSTGGGARADFWNYDPGPWVGRCTERGTVSKDGKQVVPDANVGFRQVISFWDGAWEWGRSRRPHRP